MSELSPLSESLNKRLVFLADGIRSYASSEAPDTFEELKEDYEGTGLVWVSNEHSDMTIYGDPKVNVAQRVVHDWIHIAYDLDFSYWSELKVARIQKDMVKCGGAEDELLMWLDAGGQTMYREHWGEFPKNQREFVLHAQKHSLMDALKFRF